MSHQRWPRGGRGLVPRWPPWDTNLRGRRPAPSTPAPGPDPRLSLTGHVIVIDHDDGVQMSYNHMSASGVAVVSGHQVHAEQVIAAVGADGDSTGCHLHFGLYLNGQRTDAGPFMASRGCKSGLTGSILGGRRWSR